MKTLIQLGLILVISLAVVGGVYGMSQTDWASRQSFGRRPPGEERVQTETPAGNAASAANASAAPPRASRRPGGHRHHNEPLSLASLGEFVRILLPMGLVIGGVGLMRRRGWRR